MNLGEIAIYCGLDFFFNVGVYMCRLYESNVFGARAVFGMDASCDWWRGDQSPHCIFGRASLLCGCHSFVRKLEWKF